MKTLPLNKLDEHPKNPRLVVRDELVGQLAEEMKDGFDVAHALLVRPVGDRFEVVSGHHRKLAAEKAGLKEVPCHVREMDDEEAYMQLVLCNSQKEMTPLEIGNHALGLKEKGGRGKKGGISAYAKRVGMKQQALDHLRHAAEVMTKLTTDVVGLLDKHRHLYAIRNAPKCALERLAKNIRNGWTISMCDDHAKCLKELGDCYPGKGEAWDVYTLDRAVDRYFDRKDPYQFRARSLKELVRLHEECLGIDVSDEDRKGVMKGVDVWDVRQLDGARSKLVNLAEKRASKNAWLHGDLKDLIPGIEDKSVQLLLTDPPYGMGFQSDYRLKRSVKHRHAKILGDSNPEEALELLAEMLELMLPKMKEPGSVLIFTHPSNEYHLRNMMVDRFPKRLTYRDHIVWGKRSESGVLQGGMGDVKTTFRPCHEVILYYSVGERAPILKGDRRPDDLLFAPKPQGKHHPTEKPVDLLRELITKLTVEGDSVADPFGGVGSTALAAKLSDRYYWSCEIEKGYYRRGCEMLGQ